MPTKNPPSLDAINKRIGIVYNRLTIVGLDRIGKSNHIYYLCKCICGNSKAVCYNHLLRGNIQSCGCLKREVDAAKQKEDAASKSLYRTYRQNARDRNKEFALTYQEFLNITSKDCFYCGKPPIQTAIERGIIPYFYNGIDRKDNSIGYTVENALPCCSDCNYFKGNMEYDKFIRLIKNIYEHHFR